MIDILLERTFDPGLTAQGVLAGSRRTGWCFETHGVEWQGSFLATGGKNLVCWFKAPDAESARNALRKARADISRLWTGTVYEVHESPVPNVLVERSFQTPVELAQVQAIADAGAWCLQAHGVQYARTYFSNDRRRMLCLYRASDSESVRIVQREAGMPFDAVWSFQRLGPEQLAEDAG